MGGIDKAESGVQDTPPVAAAPFTKGYLNRVIGSAGKYKISVGFGVSTLTRKYLRQEPKLLPTFFKKNTESVQTG